ncbi:MAG: pectate lyase [Roseimicrobium sp.]
MKLTRLFFLTAFASGIWAQEEKPRLTAEVTADYLALHARGQAPAGTTALQYRLSESGLLSDDAKWLPVRPPLSEDRAFSFDLPLAQSRWAELQLRALKNGEVLAVKKARAESEEFTLLTAARLTEQPERAREAWAAYLKLSREHAAKEYDALAAECRSLKLAESCPAAGGGEFEFSSKTAKSWFGSDEASTLADAVISFQTPTGGWSKAVDYARGPRQRGTHWTSQAGDAWHYCGTLDNRATTEQLKFLARVFSLTKRDDAKLAVLRGLDWIFAAQFPNGGWPQNYPLESGYHEAVTLNDNAMTHVLDILLAVAQGKEPFAFIGETVRQRAQASFDKGIECLAAAQVRVGGKLTVWCAQHDPLSLAPVAARKKEPPSLSGAESAEVLRFLMRSGPTTPQVQSMVEPALAWLQAHRVTGLRKTLAHGKTDYVADPASEEVYWARFYDVQSAQPLFAGAQDGIVYATFSGMAAKNKVSYDYFTTKPRDLIEKEALRWRKRLAKEK